VRLAPFPDRRQRSQAELVAEVQAAAQRLSVATRSWSTVTPAQAAIDEALTTAAGLQRSLAEYQFRNQSPGNPARGA